MAVVETSIIRGVTTQIFQINRRVIARNKALHFGPREKIEPVGGYELTEPSPERGNLTSDLLVHLEVRHVVDVGDAVRVGDIDAAPTRHQLMRDKLAHQVLVEAKRQSQVFHIPIIMLHVGEVLVKLGVA